MDKGLNIPILVVDDSPAMLKIIHNLLNQIGFTHIDVASSSSQALEQIQSKNYKLIICDSSIGSMTGLELLKSLKSQEKYKKIPFLVTSSDSTRTAIAEAKKAGADNYIAKPFNAATLKSKLVTLLGHI